MNHWITSLWVQILGPMEPVYQYGQNLLSVSVLMGCCEMYSEVHLVL